MEISLISFIVSFAVIGLSIFIALAARDLAKSDKRWKSKKEDLLSCKNCGGKFINNFNDDGQTCPFCNHSDN